MQNRQYIDTSEELIRCIEKLNEVDFFAIDLEFDKNRFRYGFNLCLVQIYIEDICFIIDPLPDTININLLFPVLEDASIQKIAYSFGEDLRLLHSLGCFPKNVFDVVIALRLLDYQQLSLANALYEILEIEISKSAQKSNWFMRPLGENQLHYAANDVLFLFQLKDAVDKELEAKELMDWVIEENAVMDVVSYADVDNNVIIKEKDKYGLTEFEFYIFNGLMNLREKQAKRLNRPSYQVLDKDYLREFAERPNQIHRFEKIKGIHKTLKNEPFKLKLKKKRAELAKEAEKLGLSPIESHVKRLSREEYIKKKQQRSERDLIKKKIFKPIQKLMAEEFGENAVTFIMGNRLMDELSSKDTSNLRAYKRFLVEKYAKELDFDVNPYLNPE